MDKLVIILLVVLIVLVLAAIVLIIKNKPQSMDNASGEETGEKLAKAVSLLDQKLDINAQRSDNSFHKISEQMHGLTEKNYENECLA